MDTVTKATRFQIIKPLDISWDEFGNVLRDLSYHTTKMCNAAIQLYWEHHNKRLKYKQERGVYPKDAELYGMSFRNYVYHRLRELYPLMASSNVSQTNQFVQNRWRSDVKEIMQLRKSIPSFRLGTPIQVANSNYRLYVVEGEKPEFRADVTLCKKILEHLSMRNEIPLQNKELFAKYFKALNPDFFSYASIGRILGVSKPTVCRYINKEE